ncbi:VWA domain-containing protein [Neptunitalea lumnitzerae]|uniref:VWA domain-containing protein n=1 Tax=Neptunitalea lumnitzerae TaxID=2965509 RepID=A0ABQ5MJI2_9FLAO|nr:VWA domain-containing protein [Neptunitalea sp. Y10]GLB49554.1 hypothetical protein Y10_19220 [Neptunitalea sp. Y10]
MSTVTVLYIILALAVSAAIAFFYYRQKSTKNWYIFALCRFLSLFILAFILINPKVKHFKYTVAKPVLPVLIDNTTSISKIADSSEINNQITQLLNSQELQEKFDVRPYTFGTSLETGSVGSFKEKATDISNALTTIDGIYGNTIAPVVMFTDGNQTYGTDYAYAASKLNQPVYTVVLGDTTQYEDVRISKINVNNYSYYKNEFPVEVFVNYKGTQKRNTSFKITSGNNTIYQENIAFSPENSSKKITTYIKANQLGVIKYNASVSAILDEKNTDNNSTQFAVEVLDEQSKIAIVSDFIHPDLGALKKSIESNEQREVTIGKPADFVNSLNDYQLIILYQPSNSFQELFQQISNLSKNTFVVTGSRTDWDFLNNAQSDFYKRSTSIEDVQPVLNSGFSTFITNDVPFNQLPPLKSYLGNVTINGDYDVLLQQKVRNITLEDPLLITLENNKRRVGVLFGEDSWRWRAKTYLETDNFEEYDQLISKLVFYLASNKKKERLQVEAKNFYYGNVLIDAAYFNKNYELDANVELDIIIKNKETGFSETFNMQFKNAYFEFENNSLAPGSYSYTVTVKNENISNSGSFTLIPYSVEDQFYNADYKGLKDLSEATNGQVFLLNEQKLLLNELVSNESYKPIETSKETISSIISWKWLLFILAAVLAVEWFLRKYFGMV